jgi:hypothetical protein
MGVIPVLDAGSWIPVSGYWDENEGAA